MDKHFSCFKTADYFKILELLEIWREKGFDLSKCFIKITHGPGGFHVFYEKRLDEE